MAMAMGRAPPGAWQTKSDGSYLIREYDSGGHLPRDIRQNRTREGSVFCFISEQGKTPEESVDHLLVFNKFFKNYILTLTAICLWENCV